MENKYKLLKFDLHQDSRGSLVALEKGKDFSFEVKRVYYIWGSQQKIIRGKHAHRKLNQIVICLSGSCDFTINDGKSTKTFFLNKPEEGLYLSNNLWREFTNFSENCVLMILASEHYDENEYIRDYDTFLKEVNTHDSSNF